MSAWNIYKVSATQDRVEKMRLFFPPEHDLVNWHGAGEKDDLCDALS